MARLDSPETWLRAAAVKRKGRERSSLRGALGSRKVTVAQHCSHASRGYASLTAPDCMATAHTACKTGSACGYERLASVAGPHCT